MNPADILLGIANLGLAMVFYPMVIRNASRGYCHIPYIVSVPKTLFLCFALAGFVVAELPLAAGMCFADVVCWIMLILQRASLDH